MTDHSKNIAPPTSEDFQIYNKETGVTTLRVLRDSADQVVDIRIKLTGDKQATDHEYYQFRRHFNMHNVGWDESSYIYFFQNRLAEYRKGHDSKPKNESDVENAEPNRQEKIHSIVDTFMSNSEHLAKLEVFMNTRELTLDKVDELAQELEKYKAFLNTHFSKTDTSHKNPAALKQKLLDHLNAFQKKLEEAKFTPLESDLRPVFSASANPGSLGGFISEQMLMMANGSIDDIFALKEDEQRSAALFLLPGVLCIASAAFTPDWLKVTGLSSSAVPYVNQLIFFIGLITIMAAFYRYMTKNSVQSFDLDPAVIAFSDGKNGLEQAMSLRGARYINTFTPVPKTMLEANRSLPEAKEARIEDPMVSTTPAPVDTNTQGKWLSITPYLSGFDDTKGLDQILCHFTGRDPNDYSRTGTRKTDSTSSKIFKGTWYAIRAVPLVLLAVVGEIIFTCVRLGLSALSFAWEFVTYPLRAIGNAIAPKRVNATSENKSLARRWDEMLGKFFGFTSPVRAIKKSLQGNYIRTDQHTTTRYDDALNTTRTHVTGGFQEVITKYDFTGTNAAHMIWDTLYAVGVNIANFFMGAWYMITQKKPSTTDDSASRETPKSAIDTVTQNVNQEYTQYQIKLVEKFVTGLKEACLKHAEKLDETEKGTKIENPSEKPSEMKEGTKIKKLSAEQVRNYFKSLASPKLQEPMYEPIEKWQPNTINLPFDFFDDVAVGLSDLLINTMFRHSPGASTATFMTANISFMTMCFPGAVAASGHGLSNLNIFQEVPKQISKTFCGVNPMGEDGGAVSQFISAFMQWKFATLLIEMGKGIYKKDLHFFQEFLKQPEMITLGALVLIGSGYALHYLPTIPESVGALGLKPSSIPSTLTIGGRKVRNSFLELINAFAVESGHAHHAAEGANMLEESFLGLKFCLLVELSLSVHVTHQTPKLSVIALRDELIKRNILDVENSEERRNIIKQILQELNVPTANNAILIALLDDQVEKSRTEGFDLTENLSQSLAEAAKQLESVAAAQSSNTISPTSSPSLASSTDRSPSEFKSEANSPETESPRPEPELSADQARLKAKKEKLDKALLTLAKLDAMGGQIKGKMLSWKFYDELDHAIDDYNQELLEQGRPDLYLDKEEFERAFYNKYYQQELPRLFTILFFPLIWTVTKITSYFADKYDIRWLKHSVRKSGHQNTAALGGILAFINRMGRVAAKALSYVLRVVFVTFASIKLLFIWDENEREKERANIIEQSRKIRLHRSTGVTDNMRSNYTKHTRQGGTYHADFGDLTNALIEKLKQNEEILLPAVAIGAAAVTTAENAGELNQNSSAAMSPTEISVSGVKAREHKLEEIIASNSTPTYAETLKQFRQNQQVNVAPELPSWHKGCIVAGALAAVTCAAAFNANPGFGFHSTTSATSTTLGGLGVALLFIGLAGYIYNDFHLKTQENAEGDLKLMRSLAKIGQYNVKNQKSGQQEDSTPQKTIDPTSFWSSKYKPSTRQAELIGNFNLKRSVV